MCKLSKLKGKEIFIYYIVNENYIGITTDLHKRLLKHKSKSKYDVSNCIVIESTFDLDYALKKEIYYQKKYKCVSGIRNQQGNKNPYAKQVICLRTGIFYDTIKDACNALNYNYGSVRNFIRDKNNKYLLNKI